MCSVQNDELWYSIDEMLESHEDINLAITGFVKQCVSSTKPPESLPLLLRPSLVRIGQIHDLQSANVYLERVRKILENTNKIAAAGARLYYKLNCYMLYILLYSKQHMQACYCMLAYCLLCFDYSKLESRYV